MEDGLAAFSFFKKGFIPLGVMAQKGLAVLQHGCGGLFLVGKGIILLPKPVLQQLHVCAQTGERAAVVRFTHAELPRQIPALPDRFRGGCVHRGEPLGQERDRLTALHTACVFLQLTRDHGHGICFTGRAKKDEQVIIPAHLSDPGQVLPHRLRFMVREIADQDTENTALAQSAADVAGIEQGAHGKVRILGVRAYKASDDPLLGCFTQGTDGAEEIQTMR